MSQKTEKQIAQAYRLAREQYAHLGVNTERALAQLETISVSLNCWQGDDIGGFEPPRGNLGGVMPTGQYPGKARTGDELRADLAKALALIPGRHRVNLHAIYAETDGQRVDRNELEPVHFERWMDWAKSRKLGLDFKSLPPPSKPRPPWRRRHNPGASGLKAARLHRLPGIV